MADLMQFDLVSPEKKVASSQALSVLIPGSEGDITALPNHATFLTTLRPGILVVNTENGIEEFVVTGGFVEILESGTTVLAEKSVEKAKITTDLLNEFLEEAKQEVQNASDENRSLLELRVNDFQVLANLFM
jgi:F-type H+-transporting ATPase subunit epsilon